MSEIWVLTGGNKGLVGRTKSGDDTHWNEA